MTDLDARTRTPLGEAENRYTPTHDVAVATGAEAEAAANQSVAGGTDTWRWLVQAHAQEGRKPAG